jgi:hypothetical protein
MNEPKKRQVEMETLLQRFTLTELSANQKQRVVQAARNAWQEASIQATRSRLRFALALAACIVLVFAVDMCGRLALAPWRPHLASTVASQNLSAMEEFQTLVPSVKLSATLSCKVSTDKKKGLQDYRDQLNRLLDEMPRKHSQKQTLPPKRQGRHFPAKAFSWHS